LKRALRRAAVCAAGLLAFLGAPHAALANGAMAEFPEGGVVFKHSKHISIAREDLEIGWDHIHVHYVFHSSASRPLKRTIGFPTAQVPDDDSPDSGRSDSFAVRVNGRAFKPKHHEYAWMNDTNITRKLHRMGVPIIPRAKTHLPKATMRKLKREKLIDVYGAAFYPRWWYKLVYEWTQTFAPGDTEVDISYKPLFGAEGDIIRYSNKKTIASYCLDGATQARVEEAKKKAPWPEPFRVGYILKTATNWNGPIGDFHLKVVEKDSFSSFCVPDGLKPAGKGRWTAKNFVPRSNLELLFYSMD